MKGGKLGFVGDDDVGQIDWEHILDDVPDHLGCLWDDDVAFGVGVGVGPTGSVDSWLGDLEHLLFNGDESNDNNNELEGEEMELQVDDFQLCDFLLLDSPPRSSSEDGLEEKNPLTCSDPTPDSNTNHDENEVDVDVALEVDSKHDGDDDDSPDNDDPLSKKRKRQLRNRDAAMRSRERKKMYVKDLESKSRFLEAECRRLGRLLQCCYAENQMLRFSVRGATTFGSSIAKPESAVLLPETLLLVSLVWLMGLMCLHPLASLLLLSQGAVAVASVNRKEVESAARSRPKGAKTIKAWPPPSYLNSKGCKASRTKMKCHFHSVQRRWFGNTSLLSSPAIC